jgi:hypothetical protein
MTSPTEACTPTEGFAKSVESDTHDVVLHGVPPNREIPDALDEVKSFPIRDTAIIFESAFAPFDNSIELID